MTKTVDPFESGDWVDSPGCEAFEVALEMRARSALAPTAAPVLEAHLAACASCQEHAASASQLDAALAVTAAAAPANTEWQRVHDRMRDNVKRHRRTPWVLAASGAACLAVVVLLHLPFGYAPPSPILLAMAYGWFIAMTTSAYLWNTRRVRRLLAQSDVVATYRGELMRSLQIWKVTSRVYPVLAIIFAVQVVLAYQRLMAGDSRGETSLISSSVTFVAMVAWLFFQRRVARLVKRELAELH